MLSCDMLQSMECNRSGVVGLQSLNFKNRCCFLSCPDCNLHWRQSSGEAYGSTTQLNPAHILELWATQLLMFKVWVLKLIHPPCLRKSGLWCNLKEAFFFYLDMPHVMLQINVLERLRGVFRKESFWKENNLLSRRSSSLYPIPVMVSLALTPTVPPAHHRSL